MTDLDITRQISLLADSGARSGRNCPEHARLVAYTEAKVGVAERTMLEDHLADCGFCLGQVGFLTRGADNEAPVVPNRLLNAARGVRVRWFDRVPKPALVPLASAAALILAIGVGLQLNVVSGPADVSRPASDPALESTTGLADRITAPRTEVLWEACPGALQYTVQIVNLEGDVVWEERSSGLSAAVPPEHVLEPGRRYFVWVEAHLQTGGSLKSAAVGFRVAGRE